jgi:hypothetical protein
MSSTAATRPLASAARHAWRAALLGSALTGCASLEPESAPPAAPAAQAPPAASPKAPAAPAQAGGKSIQEPTPAGVPVVAAEEGSHFEGFIASRLVARWTGDAHDADLENLVSVDWSDPREKWIRARVVARITADLDSQEPGNPFNGLTDLDGEALDFKLYDAFVDILPGDDAGRLRIGRQLDAETPVIVHYDGIAFRTHPTGDEEITAGIYGGIPVRLYQGTGDQRSLIGIFAENRPWKGGRARLDYMHLEDETVPDSGNGILGLGLWQQFENGWHAEGQYTRLEDRDRDLHLRAQWTSPNAGFSAAANWYQLFQTQDQLPADIDPYTSVLMALYPYQQFGLSASTELSEKLQLDLAVDARRVDESANLGEFNRDWERYRATAVFPGLVSPRFDVSLFGDLWEGDDRDTTAWGLDLSYDTQEQWVFGAGSYYSLYKYDLLQVSERDDVRTYYARATCKLSSKLTFEMNYDYEDDDEDQYNALRGGIVWRF